MRAADPLPDDLEEHAARGAVLAGPEQGPDPGPEAHVLAGDRRDRVLAALDELPPDQKAALVLVDMEGYPVAGGGRDPRGPDRHGEEPVRARTGPAGRAPGRPGTPGPHRSPGTHDPPPMRPNREVHRPDRRATLHPTPARTPGPNDATEGGEQT